MPSQITPASALERMPVGAVLCALCPLRLLPLFQAHAPAELELVQSLKRRDTRLLEGQTLIE
jgi:hypothetical protein